MSTGHRWGPTQQLPGDRCSDCLDCGYRLFESLYSAGMATTCPGPAPVAAAPSMHSLTPSSIGHTCVGCGARFSHKTKALGLACPGCYCGSIAHTAPCPPQNNQPIGLMAMVQGIYQRPYTTSQMLTPEQRGVVVSAAPVCECGAAKAMGAKPGAAGHSAWCGAAASGAK